MKKTAIVLLLAAGCGGPESLGEVTQHIDSRPVQRKSEVPLALISESVDTFAGYYCDSGNLVAMDTSAENGQSNQVLTALIDRIDRATIQSCWDFRQPDQHPQLIFHPAQYSYSQLKEWRDQTWEPFLDLEGSVGIWIDYKRNKIVMSGKDLQPASISTVAESAGMPEDAYVLVQADEHEKTVPVLQQHCQRTQLVISMSALTPCPEDLSSFTLRTDYLHRLTGARWGHQQHIKWVDCGQKDG